MRTIIVDEYNSIWENWFKSVETYLLTFLKDKIISIEHVGSTSVNGLASKPIIDIIVIIERNNHLYFYYLQHQQNLLTHHQHNNKHT